MNNEKFKHFVHRVKDFSFYFAQYAGLFLYQLPVISAQWLVPTLDRDRQHYYGHLLNFIRNSQNSEDDLPTLLVEATP